MSSSGDATDATANSEAPKKKNVRREGRMWRVWSGIAGKFTKAIIAHNVYIWNPRGVISRQWSIAEQFRDVIKRECSRCGWRSHKIKVLSYIVGELPVEGAPDNRKLALFLRVGPYRGLDPERAAKILIGLPSHCGRDVILRALSKLEEHVEYGERCDTRFGPMAEKRLAPA